MKRTKMILLMVLIFITITTLFSIPFVQSKSGVVAPGTKANVGGGDKSKPPTGYKGDWVFEKRCSNGAGDWTCRGKCEAPIERERPDRGPKQKEPPIPVVGPKPTRTTTIPTPTPLPPALPPAPPSVTTTIAPFVSTSVGCKVNGDCKNGFVCCENICRDLTTGVCRDVNGDGMLEWIQFSGVFGSVSRGNIDILISLLQFFRG